MSVGPGDLCKRARARYGDGGTRIIGEILAYSPVPQVLIRADDGTTEWWRHDMVDLETEDPAD